MIRRTGFTAIYAAALWYLHQTGNTQHLMLGITAVVLLSLPVIGKYTAVINTLVHEVGHATVALLTGGRVSKIELFANSEGTAWSSHRFWLGRLLTSAAGYPAASALAYAYLYLLAVGKPLVILTSFGIIAITAMIFWVRNLYGLYWVVSLFGILTFLWIATLSNGNQGILQNIDPEELIDILATTLTFLLTIASMTSAFDILQLSIRTPMNAGDTTNLWKATWVIPPPVWGVAFMAQALAFAYFGIRWLIT